MKRALIVTALAALLILVLFTGCGGRPMTIQIPNTDGAPLQQTLSTEPDSKPEKNMAVEPKSQQPVIKENNPVAPKPQQPASATPERLMASEITATAYTHAKVAADKVRDLDIDLELERGVTFYEVSFDVEGWEYEYKIEAYTGKILHNRTERDT